MTRSLSLATLGLVLVLAGSVSGACTQCGTIRISLECPMGPNSAPVEGTSGLICDVIKNKAVNLTCHVDALHTGKVKSYAWLDSATTDVTSVVNMTYSHNATQTQMLKCKATVTDIEGTDHVLLSNLITIKPQDMSAAVTKLTETKTIANLSISTELKCSVMPLSAWYPEPDVVWEKDGKPIPPQLMEIMTVLTADLKAKTDMKKGSLVLHGVSSNLTGQYTCSLMYKARTAMSKEMKPTMTLGANYTVALAAGSLTSVTNSTVYQASLFAGAGATWPADYVGPGIPVIFNCQSVGGDASGTKPRVHYRWYRVGSDYGFKLMNTTNANCTKSNDKDDGGKKEKRGADGKEEGPDPCWYISTNMTSATEELGPMNSEKYGVEVHGSWMTFKAAYSELASVYQCAVSLTNVSTTTKHNFTQPTMLGGMGVDTGSTCGYSSTVVPLPLMDFMTNYTSNMQPHLALPQYTSFAVIKNAKSVTPVDNKINELSVRYNVTEQSCEYYQVMRTIKDHSTVVKTILVQNLGAAGSKVYNASEYMPSKPNITVPVDTKTTITATCTVLGNSSVAEWVTDCPQDTYSLVEQSANSKCDWAANITFSKTKMQGACKAMCRSKSQCTRVEGIPFMAMPCKLRYSMGPVTYEYLIGVQDVQKVGYMTSMSPNLVM